MFSRMSEWDARCWIEMTIKKKEFLSVAIGSDKFENGVAEIQLNSAIMLILFFLELYISKMNLETGRGFVIFNLRKVNLRNVRAATAI